MKLTAAQAALLARLPEAFQLFEAYSRSDAPGTVVRRVDGTPLFHLTTGEPRTIRGLMQAEAIVKVETLSNGSRGTDVITVWMRA